MDTVNIWEKKLLRAGVQFKLLSTWVENSNVVLRFLSTCILKWSTSKDNVKATFVVVSSGWTCVLLLEAKTSRCSIQPSLQMSCGALTLSKAMRCNEMPSPPARSSTERPIKRKLPFFSALPWLCKGKLMFSVAAAFLGKMACERDQENQRCWPRALILLSFSQP